MPLTRSQICSSTIRCLSSAASIVKAKHLFGADYRGKHVKAHAAFSRGQKPREYYIGQPAKFRQPDGSKHRFHVFFPAASCAHPSAASSTITLCGDSSLMLSAAPYDPQVKDLISHLPRAQKRTESIPDFLRHIVDYGAKAIFALGKPNKDFYAYWANNHHYVDEKNNLDYQVELSADGSKLTIIDNKFGQKTVVDFHLLLVEDNAAFNLDDAGLTRLLDLYKLYSQPELAEGAHSKLLVHCTMGVGRTGMVRVIFAMLRDAEVQAHFAKLLAAEEIVSPLAEKLGERCSELLTTLRQQRFTLVTEAQLDGAIQHAFLLYAKQQRKDASYIQVLRSAMGLADQSLTRFATAEQLHAYESRHAPHYQPGDAAASAAKRPRTA